MSKTLFVLMSIAFVLAGGLSSVAQAADPDLVGWWWFDEDSGTVASDSSMYGNHGTLMDNPQWVPGVFGNCLQFDGVDDYVEVPHDESLTVDTEVAVMAWINTERITGPGGEGWQGILSKSNSPRSYSFYTEWTGHLHFSGAGVGPVSTTEVPLNEWAHVGATVLNGQVVFYVNGETAGTSAAGSLPGASDTATVVLGRTNEGANRSFLGLMDDVRIYRRGVDLQEIQRIMTGADLGTEVAADPIPADEEEDVRRDIVMSWMAGKYAVTHDVYLGTVAEDVNNASRSNPMDVLVSQGQTDTEYDPEGLLEIGQTYYWRIDEVNATPDTIFKGELWSFTTEPFAYPVEGVIATSNMSATTGLAPDALVDGSGLDENDQHSTDVAEMWAGNSDGAETPYIQFEFDRIYKLQEMLVWNYNMAFEAWLGVGIKDVTVEYSQDGQTWATLGDIVLTQAPGTTTYTAGDTIVFDGVAAKFVRLMVNDNFGTTTQYGLSEVRFLYLPVVARDPEPADGATNVEVDTVLGWRGGREAVVHEVYLSTDEAAVIDGTALAGTSNVVSYAPSGLEYGNTYYWMINEVNDAEATSSWASDVWSFSTLDYAVIDDFESYNDDIEAGGTIWQTWIDGLDDNTNGGAVVGYDQSPFAEMTTVHGGGQSMPFRYSNTSASAISEADRTFSPAQNWTTHGIKSLSLWFYGDVDNGGQLYVKINNTKVVYDGDSSDLSMPQWQTWNIDLSAVGANLNSVSTLTIGVQGSGSGLLFIDDVRLYPEVAEPITPVQPDGANLMLHYKLDEGSGSSVNDASGNGNHGTIEGNPTWTTGHSGSALQFAGLSDYIATNSKLLDSISAFTIACWLKGDFLAADYMGLIGQNDCIEYGFLSGNSLHLYSAGGGSITGNWPYDPSEWHSAIAVGDGTNITIYVDGKVLVKGGSTIADNYGTSSYTLNIAGGGIFRAEADWYAGQIDDIRVYQRALSAAEAAGLAGKTYPVHLGF